MKKQELKNNKPRDIDGARPLDSLKWLAVVGLFVLSIVGFYYYAQTALYIRVVGLLAVLGLGALLASQTVKGQQALQFIKGARSEARKVVWPNRQETTQSTIIVLIVVVIVSICLWILDAILFRLVSLLTG